MKRLITLSLAFLGLAMSSIAQTEENVNVTITSEQCSSFMKTPPLREMLKTLTPVDDENLSENWVPKDRKIKPSMEGVTDHGILENNGIDPAMQSTQGTRSGEGMLKVSWQAQFGLLPPDPTGAAGPEQYVQAVNSTYRVYDKEGDPLTPAYSLGSLWSSTSDGDPIVMYDRFADRWFISQFKISNNSILIAVSETSDALGAYYVYQWTMPSLPDYPKYGVWSNTYVMTANSTSNDCVGFEREKMLLGDATAAKINLTFPNFYQFFNSVAPAYAEGPTPPDSDEPCYFFAVQDNSWPGVSVDHIKVLKATFDWTTPANSSVVNHQTINTEAFNSVFTPSWNDLIQKGSDQKLDAVAGIFMYRAQYRRFDDYNVVMLCHTVDVDNTNRAGVRWYELRDNNDGQWYIFQQGTYAPDSENSRWMGSIAMDINGNIGLAYSFAGPNHFAGLRYTARYKDDPLGQMTVIEQIAQEGQGAQPVSANGMRYGDYSQMTMDPSDDLTFWYTGQYLGTGGSRRTRIFSFTGWTLLGEEEKVATVPFFNAYQPQSETVRVIWNNLEDNNVTATITDVQGKIISTQQISTENTQQDFDVSTVASGIYFVTLTGQNTNLSKKIYLAK